MDLKISVLLVISVLSSQVTSTIYNRKCPEVKDATSITCNVESSYDVLALLPTTTYTLNIFTDLFGKVDCMRFRLLCSGLAAFSFVLKCENENSEDIFRYCYSFGVFKIGNRFQLEPFMSPGVNCPKHKIWNDLHVLEFIEASVIILWSCRDINSTSTELGVLVALNNNVKPLKKDTYFKQAMKSIETHLQIPQSDLIISKFDSSDCLCSDCDFLMKCLVKPGYPMNDIEDNEMAVIKQKFVWFLLFGLLISIATWPLTKKLFLQIKKWKTQVTNKSHTLQFQ